MPTAVMSGRNVIQIICRSDKEQFKRIIMIIIHRRDSS